MEMHIYQGTDSGIYANGSFQQFMQKFSGAKRVFFDTQELDYLCECYHIEPEGVTLLWTNTWKGSSNWEAKVTLYGKNSLQVRERIHDATERIKEAQQTFEKSKKALENIVL